MKPDGYSTEQSLEGLWATKYVHNLTDYAWETSASGGYAQIAEKLLNALRFASSQAWANTEALLASEMQRHRIQADFIDPWQIASDSRLLFEKAAESYNAKVTPAKFSVVISPECGRIRQKYTAKDPRVLGFMSMQFHYTGQLLLEKLEGHEKGIVDHYFKVIDDHLYMPLQRAYQAAATHPQNSDMLLAVQNVLPLITPIAEFICARVASQNPEHQCYTGSLSNVAVRTSSIRDVEMFQIYLCLCALEGGTDAVQQELFPLCVMLYPPLQVKWFLVRQMLTLLGQEMRKRLLREDYDVIARYIKALYDMFSLSVFPEHDVAGDAYPGSALSATIA